MTEELRKAMEEDALKLEQNFPGISIHEAYKCGGDFLRLHAWHDAQEEPKVGREVIIQTRKGMKQFPNKVKMKMSWEFYVRITGAQSWAYSEDFLPDNPEGTATADNQK